MITIDNVRDKDRLRFKVIESGKIYRQNGKVKTWKRDTSRFSIPVKYGLYEYGYVDNTNQHLVEIVE
jgi:hypothetical protein